MKNKRPVFKKHKLSTALSIAVMSLVLTNTVHSKQIDLDAPANIELGIWKNTELVLGQSRTIEAMLIPHKSLPYPNTPNDVLQKQLVEWRSSNPSIASVDKFGRVTAFAPGKVKITAHSVTNTKVSATVRLEVVESPSLNKKNKTMTVNGKHITDNPVVLQKQVTRYASDHSDSKLDRVRNRLSRRGSDRVVQNDVVWAIEKNVNPGRQGVYIVRTDFGTDDRNRTMYFMGNRYMPMEASITFTGEVMPRTEPLSYEPLEPKLIMSDGEDGIWVMADSGALSHIAMSPMSLDKKAALMSRVSQRVVDRRGSISESDYHANEGWQPRITDNDGLWTAMYSGGELMRYATLKREGASKKQLAAARQSAIRSLKFDLLLSNISGRKGDVQTKVRPIYGEDGGSYKLQEVVLRKDGEYSINNKPTGPTENGGKVGKIYDMKPLDDSQWNYDTYAIGALGESNFDYDTKTRTIEGFFARTYALQGADVNGFIEGYTVGTQAGAPGNYFPGGHTVFRGGELGTKGDLQGKEIAKFVYCDGVPTEYGGTKECEPVGEKMVGIEINAELPIPDVLKCEGAFAEDMNCLNALQDDQGNLFTEHDILYKADTSNDESIGHFFVYRIAYDILDESDPEEKALKTLVRKTMQKWADHVIANEYNFVDASGQPTKWGKTSRDYFNNDYAWEDAALNSMVLVAGMKLAAYVTGEQRYDDEYEALASKNGYDYATLANEYWSRWEAFAGAKYGDDTSSEGCPGSTPVVENGFPSIDTMASGNDGGGMCGDGIEDPNDPVQVEEWVREVVNTSDEEMAALTWYILFTTEEAGSQLHKQYVKAYDEWYRSMTYQENPFFDYVRQLGQPKKQLTNAYGRKLQDAAIWNLQRHPIDTRRWGAYDFARPDVWKAGIGTVAATRADRFPIMMTNDSGAYDSRTMRELVLSQKAHTTLPFDERIITKYNNSTYNLGFKPVDYHNWIDSQPGCFDGDPITYCDESSKPNPAYGSPTKMEGSTTFTLPYWLGRYHNFIAKPQRQG
ncbi:Ig-like domain-containing protein [Photobacterium sp. DNB23_23_1]